MKKLTLNGIFWSILTTVVVLAIITRVQPLRQLAGL